MSTFSTIEAAVERFRQGEFVIVIDDADRENEGDFIIAAEKITPEKVEVDERIRREFCKPFYLPLSFRAKEYIKNVL